MNGFTHLKDIRFPDTKANILLRGGMISREDLMDVKNSTIMMRNVHFGIAKRINDVTSLEVRYLDEWRSVMCGDTEKLQSIYALTPSVEDAEKYEHKTFTDKVEIKPDQKVEETVKIVEDMIENHIGPSIVGDNFPPSSDDEEETHEEEKVEEEESTEEVEESSEDEVVEEEVHEEVEVADYTGETPSDHDPEDDYDADEHSEEDKKPEEESSEENGAETNPTEVFATGMAVGDAIEGSEIGTITGVTTIATDSTDTIDTVEEPTSDVSKVEAATTSTSTASTNNQGNARRQVNINTHGKRRHR